MKTMKIISALSVGQVLLTLFVIFKLVNIDNRLDNHETVADPHSPSAVDFVDSRSDLGSTVTSTLPEEKLRKIIREELVANAMASAQPAVERYRESGPPKVDTSEDRYRLERVSQQLDYFESVGEISNREMAELQVEIAKLQETDRRLMFNRLVQSMNAGRIKSLF